jgi:long-subunit acyl-CoA synthetase (AMP-forming)
VAFLDKNHPAAIELVLASAWLGAVTVPVNYRLAPVEIAYVLEDSGTAVVIAGERYADELEAGDTGARVIRLGDAYEVLLRQSPPLGDPGIGAECFLQIYTAGTTGFPKGVELTHRNVEAHSEALGTRIGFTPDSVNMAPCRSTTSADWPGLSSRCIGALRSCSRAKLSRPSSMVRRWYGPR